MNGARRGDEDQFVVLCQRPPDRVEMRRRYREPQHRAGGAHQTGSAAGLLNAVQQFGGTLGVAAFGSVFLHHPVAIDRAVLVAVAAIVVTVGTAHLMRLPRLLGPGRAAQVPASTGR